GARSSLPFGTIATRGRAYTRAVGNPQAASAPKAPGDRGSPRRTSRAPRTKSSPTGEILSPNRIGRGTRIVPVSRSTSSKITTEFAPTGTAAPVAIATASPGPTGPANPPSAKTSPTRRRTAGRVARAPRVSVLRTAYPSQVALRNEGTSRGDRTSTEETRPNAASSATCSVRSTGVAAARRRRRAVSTGRRCPNACISMGGFLQTPLDPSGGRARAGLQAFAEGAPVEPCTIEPSPERVSRADQRTDLAGAPRGDVVRRRPAESSSAIRAFRADDERDTFEETGHASAARESHGLSDLGPVTEQDLRVREEASESRRVPAVEYLLGRVDRDLEPALRGPSDQPEVEERVAGRNVEPGILLQPRTWVSG